VGGRDMMIVIIVATIADDTMGTIGRDPVLQTVSIAFCWRSGFCTSNYVGKDLDKMGRCRVEHWLE
jgi:hypothetical protein